MIKLLYTYIKSLFTPTDIILTLNGSQLTFNKEGDIRLVASRNLITNGKYIFLNGKEEDIKKVMFDKDNKTKGFTREQCEEHIEIVKDFYLNNTKFEKE